MEYSLFSNIILIIIIPFIIMSLGTIFYSIYAFLVNPHKDLQLKWTKLKNFNNLKRNFFIKEEDSITENFIICIYLTFAIILAFLIANGFEYGTFQIKFNLILIVFLIFLPFLFAGFSYKSHQLYSTSKEYFKVIFGYFLPLIISIISIFILLIGYGIILTELSISELITIQNYFTIHIAGITFPAYFIILNPFAAIAFITAMMGVFRTFKSKIYNENKLNQTIFAKILRNITFLAIGLLFVFLFLGGGFFSQYKFFNFISCILITFGLILVVALIDNDRPKLFIERDIWNYINVPIFFSLLAVLYSFILITFNLNIQFISS
ncbi:MAG: hypothetical protein ACTSR8_17315 [Promethearchaeota archaeon]